MILSLLKKVEGCHARNTPPGDIKMMELMIADLLTLSISRIYVC
jgi:hypothetical protein